MLVFSVRQRSQITRRRGLPAPGARQIIAYPTVRFLICHKVTKTQRKHKEKAVVHLYALVSWWPVRKRTVVSFHVAVSEVPVEWVARTIKATA
jgi:hypothetical protein